MRGRRSFRSARAATVLVSTILMELAGIYLALLCLSREHSPWLWAIVALDFSVFVLLLKLQRFASHKVFAVYAAIFFIAAGAWFWQVRSAVITSADWWGLAVALVIIAVISAMRAPK
jgi:drug/metabolite transporter superfamily protein YnfA